MKKSWKQLIAITCALSMIACLLPAGILAEEGRDTAPEQVPVTEPAQVLSDEPAEVPAEEPAAEPTEAPAEQTGTAAADANGQAYAVYKATKQNDFSTVTVIASAKNGALTAVQITSEGEDGKDLLTDSVKEDWAKAILEIRHAVGNAGLVIWFGRDSFIGWLYCYQ